MSASPASLLQAPRLTGREQSRPRLRMAGGTGTTAVWASAGTGKTTLLAQWAEQLRSSGETAAWISLPAAGPSLPRLAALTRTSLASGREAAERAGGRGAGSRVTLLIDDLHHLTSPDENRWLADLIESPPRDVRIVLAGRHPPQVLATRPSRPGTAEYRTGDLAFTGPETAVFLAARGIQLAPPDVDALQHRTGGWAAALTLWAGLAGRNGAGNAGPDAGSLVAAGLPLPLDFEAGRQAAADYLVTEILDLLPATYLRFLLALCVADAVTVPAAVRLSRRADAGLLLDQLELQTGLLEHSGVSGSSPTYVLHPVLLAYLRTEFHRRDLAAYAEALGATDPMHGAHGPDTAHGAARDGRLNDLLTPREREILRELPRYQTVRNIAARQRLSPNTVKTHIRSLYQKLGVSNRAAAVDKAFENGLL